jgi:hypothetical protein
MATQFRQLNDGWNAEPNAPHPGVQVDGRDVVLTFLANPFQFPRFAEDQRLRLRFTSARRYRLGSTNDEVGIAERAASAAKHRPGASSTRSQAISSWSGVPNDWHIVGDARPPSRHFLFDLRDETFECEADDWVLEE